MILIICLIIFIWSVSSLCSDYDHEYERKFDYQQEERRHKELIEATKKSSARKRTRTVVKDSFGNIIAQEIIEDIDLDDIGDIDLDG